jgi:NAD-dependent deacetylase
MPVPPEPALRALERARGKKVLFLTGAGISAESGIPTFRGQDGYWKVGSRNYHPEELATREAFERIPEAIWAWYLYRRGVCRGAAPNEAHRALVRLEEALGGRFVLVTQNVDGLHLRAGSTRLRTLEIHGNVDYMRCAAGCVPGGLEALVPLPDGIEVARAKDRAVSEKELALLRCAKCGGWSRPHVLWFDEFYDEELFRARSALQVADEADLLVVVGTAGQTNLPRQIVAHVASRKVPILVIDTEETVFWELALSSGGADLRGKASDWVPVLVEKLI